MPRKKQAESDMAEPMDRPLQYEVGDIIQVVTKPHPNLAWIGIIHSVDGESLVCYQPGKGGPLRFMVGTSDVKVVGKAILKWSQALPATSTNDRSYLDKI